MSVFTNTIVEFVSEYSVNSHIRLGTLDAIRGFKFVETAVWLAH